MSKSNQKGEYFPDPGPTPVSYQPKEQHMHADVENQRQHQQWNPEERTYKTCTCCLGEAHFVSAFVNCMMATMPDHRHEHESEQRYGCLWALYFVFSPLILALALVWSVLAFVWDLLRALVFVLTLGFCCQAKIKCEWKLKTVTNWICTYSCWANCCCCCTSCCGCLGDCLKGMCSCCCDCCRMCGQGCAQCCAAT